MFMKIYITPQNNCILFQKNDVFGPLAVTFFFFSSSSFGWFVVISTNSFWSNFQFPRAYQARAGDWGVHLTYHHFGWCLKKRGGLAVRLVSIVQRKDYEGRQFEQNIKIFLYFYFFWFSWPQIWHWYSKKNTYPLNKSTKCWPRDFYSSEHLYVTWRALIYRVPPTTWK